MAWHFAGKIDSRQLLPSALFSIRISDWRSSELVSVGLYEVEKAHNVQATISRFDHATDILSNMTKRGSRVSASHTGKEALAFVTYFEGEAESPELLGVTIGLAEDAFSAIEGSLAAAQRADQTVSITASGGFSVIEDNPHSEQPTVSQFRIGHAMRLYNPVRISIL